MNPSAWLGVLILVSAIAVATPVSAQVTSSPRLYGGLFGASDTRRVRHRVDFSLSAVEAHDSDVPAEARGLRPGDFSLTGNSTMLIGDAHYQWQGPRVQFVAKGESVLRRYAELEDVRGLSYSVGVGLSAHLDGRTVVTANQSAAYSPSYLYGLFPRAAENVVGDSPPAAADYAISNFESYTYATTLTLTRGLSRRSRMSASGDFQNTDFLHESSGRSDLTSRGVRADYLHNLARNTAVRVGYGYRTGTIGYGSASGEVAASEHKLEIGLQYVRPVSRTRRMLFELNVGSSALNPDSTISDDVAALVARLYRVTGDAAVSWQFSRSWQARGTYRRGLEFVAELIEPVYIDGVTAELTGLLTRRLDVLASGGYSSGASALTTSAATFDTYTGHVRARFAVTRSVAVHAEYLYYFYDFTQNLELAPGIPPGLERQGVRVGLTVWIPAVRR